MADQNAAALQTAINRFSAALGFVPLAVDGNIGPKSLAAATIVLFWLGGDGAAPQDLAPAAETLLMTTNSAAQLASNASQISDFFNTAANRLNMPAGGVVSLVVAGTRPAPKVAISAKTADALRRYNDPNLLDKFKLMPPWQQAGIGIATGLLLILGYRQFKGRSA